MNQKLLNLSFVVVAALSALSAFGSSAPSLQTDDRRLGTQAVGVEVLGSTGQVGLSYDARFRPGANYGWGFRTGLNHSVSAFGRKESSLDWCLSYSGGHGIPLEINYLTGKRNSHFEVGLGCTLGLYHDTWDEVICTNPDQHDKWTPETIDAWYSTHGNDSWFEADHPCDRFTSFSRRGFGYYCYFNLGYRYQRPSGFLFRVGVAPQFGFPTRHDLYLPFMPVLQWPYLAVGWTF